MRAIKAVAGLVMAVLLLAGSRAAAAEEEKNKNPWAGSMIVYENAFSAISLDKGAEQAWNPYYAHSLSLMPAWKLHDYLGLKARFDIEQELTNSDDTNRRYQWLISDLRLYATGGKGYTEPFTGIKINGQIGLFLPTSQQSQAQTLILATGPGLRLSRKFDVLQGLTVGYYGHAYFGFHEATTAQYDGPTITCNDPESLSCQRFFNSGVRNNQYIIAHGPELGLDITDKLSVSTFFYFADNITYKLEPVTVQTDMGPVQIDSSDDDTRLRTGQWFSLEVGYQALDMLGVSLGVSSLYADLASDGTYRTPFFNRFTNVYLDLSLDIDAVVNRF